jgi:WD40 repeat protein
MATLPGGLGAMRADTFSPDGHTFVGVVGDGSIVAWDVSDRMHPRRLIAVPDFHSDLHAFSAFSPDRRTLVTAMEQRAGIQWNVLDWVESILHPLDYACMIARRGLNLKEWADDLQGLPYQRTCPR